MLTRVMVVCFALLMLISHFIKGTEILQYRTDYKNVMDIVNLINPNLKVVSSQNMIQNLYAKQGQEVKSVPESFLQLSQYSMLGYRYLVIDPQAYISYTKDEKRFSLQLKDYLNLIIMQINPEKVLPHFNEGLLERFVLEHNENLLRSLAFLKESKKRKLGALRIYDIQKILSLINAKRNTTSE